MTLSRRKFVTAGIGLAASAALSAESLAALGRARKVGLKIGATDWNLRQEAKPDSIEMAKRIGFDGVEVSLGMGPVGSDHLPLAEKDTQARFLEESKRNRLPIAGTCLNILHRNYLKNDKLGQKWVADSIPITKALGGRVILLPFFGRGALTTHEEMDYVGDFLKEIGPEALKTGVIFGLENTISAVDNARILDRAKSDGVKVFYDVGNSTRGGFDVVKEIRWLGKDRICEFHLKDNPHYLGEGKIDFPAVIDAIADIGFKGWAHLETDAPSNVESDMGRNLRFVRELIDKRNRVGKS